MVIILESLRLKNWKGATDTTINFAPDITDIYGENGSGKTRTVDSWYWSLTGKDSMNRANFEIKNRQKPELNETDSEVYATFLRDGRQHRIIRTFREKWVRPKGSDTPVFDTNTTLYSVDENGTFSKSQFETWFQGIFLSDGLFNILTSPLFFNTDNGDKWKWTNRRDFLIKMAGDISTDDIFESAGDKITAERVAALKQVIADGKSFDSYKNELAGRIKKAKEQLEGIPKAIQKLNGVKPAEEKWSELKGKIELADKSYETLNNLFNDKSKVDDKKAARVTEKKDEVRKVTEEAMAIKSGVQSKITEENNDIRNKIALIESEIRGLEGQILVAERTESNAKIASDKIKKENANSNIEYDKLKAEQEPKLNPEDKTCDKCGNPIDPKKLAANLEKLVGDWREKNVAKKAEMKLLLRKQLSDFNASAEQLNKATKDLSTLRKSLTDKQEDLEKEKAKPLGTAKTLAEKLEKNKEFQVKQNLIEKLEKEIKAIENEKEPDAEEKEAEVERLKLERKSADDMRLDLRTRLNNKVQFDKITKEVDELTKQEQDLNKAIADEEGLQFAITKFNEARNAVVQERINKLFRTDKYGKSVSFKMFQTSDKGVETEWCELWYDGKTWGALNYAQKVWAGLECIYAFSKYLDIYFPVFIDNRESVNEIPPMDCQIINLRVYGGGDAEGEVQYLESPEAF